MGLKLKSNAGGSVELQAKDGITTDEDIEFPLPPVNPPTDPKLLPTAYGSSWSTSGTYGDELEEGCYNIASIANIGAGKFFVTFTEPMDNTDYKTFISIYQGNATAGSSMKKENKTVNGFEFWTYGSTGSMLNNFGVQFLVFGGKN